ncbi:MAG: hypothetical protein J6I73_06305 [Treponema sp.]|nr:hypothetical protein [Treponema sp.]
MADEVKKLIAEKQKCDGFIKVTDEPVSGLTSEQKVFLNRKANMLYNQGDIEQARRIYTTTGYSDGLTRVGDVYMQEHKSISALKQYLLAHNTKKAEPIYQDIAKVISAMLKDDAL